EGGEASGKSTHAEALKEELERLGFSVLLTHEPGGTEMGSVLRKDIIFKADYYGLDALTEMLLFFADRWHHLRTVVIPALAAGKIVIMDRSWFSTWAYQIRAGELGKEKGMEDFFY